MRISGFTYVRNGFNYQYPFIQSIQSILPIVDEMIVVIGDSSDGSREAVVALNSNKIRIIDSVWDMSKRENGVLFAEQSNIGLDNISGDWAIHIQADEVIHENDIQALKEYILKYNQNEKVEALLFPFYHFWGDYCYIRHTRRTHDFEIRAFKVNNGSIRAYKDSQGFRKYSSIEAYNTGETGDKLAVVKLKIPIFHYSGVRSPKLMATKATFFHRFWHSDEWIEKNKKNIYDYNNVDKLTYFDKSHPKNMESFIAAKDWAFTYDPSKSRMKLKDKILNGFESIFGIRIFSYKNYKVLNVK